MAGDAQMYQNFNGTRLGLAWTSSAGLAMAMLLTHAVVLVTQMSHRLIV